MANIDKRVPRLRLDSTDRPPTTDLTHPRHVTFDANEPEIDESIHIACMLSEKPDYGSIDVPRKYLDRIAYYDFNSTAGNLCLGTWSMKARRSCRLALALVALCLTVFISWHTFLSPALWQRPTITSMSQNDSARDVAHNQRVNHLVQVQHLDAKLLPGGSADPQGRRRLIFVGDIHGCRHELRSLLDKVGFNAATDHLIAAGDVISKGPDSVGTLDELLNIGATSVRGNHEDAVLTAVRMLADSTSLETPSAADKAAKKKHDSLAKQLSPRHIKYLKQMPLILSIPPLPLAEAPSKHVDPSPITTEILVVHAGLVPGVALEKQDPYFVQNMRSIHKKTHKPSVTRSGKSGGGDPWIEIWNLYNDRLARRQSTRDIPERSDVADPALQQSSWLQSLWSYFWQPQSRVGHPQVVIYGHDSKAGLQIHHWTKGLDSGCVNGDKLTALVLDARGRTELFSVKCTSHRT